MIICLGLAVSVAAPGSFAAGKTKYVAHRGLSAKAPENTIAAFRLAAKKKGLYGVEFDIWEAKYKDGEDPLLLVMHDDNTRRMCGKKAKIRKISRASLHKYSIRSGNGIHKYSGQKIPTAEQALDTIYGYSKGAIPVVELKHRLSGKALKYLLSYIGDRPAIIISFEYRAVADAARMAREMGMEDQISTMYLCKRLPASRYSSAIKKVKKAGIDGISVKYKWVKKKTIKRFHRAGIEVGVWTIPNKKTARKYKRMGADYITANGIVY